MRNVIRTAIALTVIGSTPVMAGEVALSVGVFDVGKSPSQGEAGFELRTPTGGWGLEATAGVSATEEGSVWIFGGLRRPFEISDSGGWQLAPGFAVALYEQGDGKDLGGVIEFRSSLELSYQFGNRSRIGVALYHLSNGGLYTLNPGSNSAVLSFGLPLR